MKVSIIVLAYNQLEQGTKPCIESIYKHTDANKFELIVVDNNSSDGTAEYLKQLAKEKSNVKLVLNDTNRGYAGGNNDGIKMATGDYLILLNNDTLVCANWLENLLLPFSLDSAVGLCGPVTNSAENVQYVCLSDLNENNYESITEPYIKKNQNSWFITERLIFFCVAIKKEVIEKVGLLDENFGRGYFEDDDYCARASNAGYKLAIAESSFVYHKGSLSFKGLKDFDEIMAKNRKLYINKHKKYSIYSDNLVRIYDKLKLDIDSYISKNTDCDKDIENIVSRFKILELHMKRAKENEEFLVKKYQMAGFKALFRVLSDNIELLSVIRKKLRKPFKWR